MKYKINISIEREDGAIIQRVYDYKDGVDYNEKVDDIINSLEEDI